MRNERLLHLRAFLNSPHVERVLLATERSVV